MIQWMLEIWSLVPLPFLKPAWTSWCSQLTYYWNHYIYYCGQESLRRNGVAIIVNKRVWNAVLGCSLKNDRRISVHFQGKPFNITVIQAYVLTSIAEEAEVEQFCEDLQDWNAKEGSQETPGVTGKFVLGVRNEARQRLIEFGQVNALVKASILFGKRYT